MSKFNLKIVLGNKYYNIDNCYNYNYIKKTKFEKDCVHIDDKEYFILIDGIILNKNSLIASNHTKEWAFCIKKLYKEKGDSFFEQLKGSYYGILFDKGRNKWIVFTDHIGSKPIYYYKNKENIYISNNYTDLVKSLKNDSIKLSLNENAAYLLLTYGYVFEDITILNDIKRLRIGYFGILTENRFTEKRFFKLNNEPIKITEAEAIEEIDRNFRNAIELAFNKDLEYGYKHLVGLSGGLDSRMTSWVAHDMGYTNQLNITFSQTGYLDETIAKKIAADLNHEWLFKALDNGTFLKAIEKINKITGGNVLYYASAQVFSFYRYLNFSNLGLLHTGQLGDVIMSSYSSLPSYKHEFSKLSGAFSKKLQNKIDVNIFREDYSNEELFKLNIRGFYGMNMGLIPLQGFSETYSPFYDIDFMIFSLSLPIDMRFNHRLYKKWLVSKYPKAAEYIWESKNAKITDRFMSLGNKDVALKNIPIKILQKIGMVKGVKDTTNSMVPLDYWYQSNSDIRIFQDEYFKMNIDRIKDKKELHKDCINNYHNGTGKEKNQVLTLLSVMNIYNLS
jgi:asparagine synthase (glutamine-hydrolysing)